MRGPIGLSHGNATDYIALVDTFIVKGDIIRRFLRRILGFVFIALLNQRYMLLLKKRLNDQWT